MTRHDEPGDAVADPKKHRFPSSDGAAQPLADEHQGTALPAIQLTGAWVIALWLGVYEVGLGVLVATRYGDTVFDTVEGSLQISLIFSAPAIWLLTDRLLVRIPQVIDRLLGVIGRALPQAQHLIDRLIRHWQATVKARHRRAARRRRQTGWRLVLGPRTAWERLATHRSFGDQLADVGVRIAVSSAVVLGVVFAQTQTPPRSSTTGDSSTYWFLAVAVVVFAPAVIANGPLVVVDPHRVASSLDHIFTHGCS